MTCWGQRLASSCAIVAFLATLLGALAPYWSSGELRTNSSGFHGGHSSISAVEDSLDYHGGLFYFCVDIPDGGRECDLFDFDAEGDLDFLPIWITIGQLTFALMGLVMAVCCRCRGIDQNLCYGFQGVLTGLSGLCGVAVTVTYLVSPSNLWGMTLFSHTFSWALAVYASGVGLFLLLTLALLLASGICPCMRKRREGYKDLDKEEKQGIPPTQ